MSRRRRLNAAVERARTWLVLASFAGAVFMALGAAGAVAWVAGMKPPPGAG